jgi:UDP-N-acetylglucosamine/UDP-N-acetylgalactosamine diphosphorylase
MFDAPLLSLQLQAERVAALRRLAAARPAAATSPSASLPWYIMTSAATRAKTEAFFSQHAFFGLPRADVAFFDQGVLPCVSGDGRGRIILESRSRVATAPDGNGGVYAALRASGALADMRARGVTCVYVYCVDNALVRVGDPEFIGFCGSRGVAAGAKVIPKAYPEEAVGVFAAGTAPGTAPGGGIRVVEYSEIPPELAAARNVDGQLAFNAANIALHYFSLPFLERCCGVAGPDATHAPPAPLPYHAARKKVPCVSACGQHAAVAPPSANALKLEAFIFDVYPLADAADVALLEGARGADFAPVKNAEGDARDSPTTARAALSDEHRRWASAAGASVRGDGLFEISPALSYGGEGLGAMVGRAYDTPCHVEAL